MSLAQSIIRFDDVSKSFSRHRGHMLIREHISRLIHGRHAERFHALKHVSFEIGRGESVALIGHNGAGKSTVLGLLAGLAQPDSGRITVDGRVAALLELGSGFHADLTGRENVSLNASLLGFSRKETDQCYEQIVEFSGIGDFIDEPLRTYSSGMIMRLAFSVAVNVQPDIVLIDEVLAVGDAAFQEKCTAKIRDFRNMGKALVCVSHGNSTVRELCDRAIWLDHGELLMDGSVEKVLAAYNGVQPHVAST